jgi:hypothetical protein
MPLKTTLPLRQIVFGALWLVWTKRIRLIQALALPIVLMLLLENVIPLSYPEEPGLMGNIVMWTVFIASYIPYGLFIMTCHRIFLLGDDSVPRYGIWQFSYRELQFFGWLIAMYAMYFLTFTPMFVVNWVTIQIPDVDWLRFMSTPLSLGVAFYAMYVLARFSVLVPAAALEHRPTIKGAWRLTRGEGIRLFVLVILLPIILNALINRLPISEGYQAISYILYNLLWMIVLCFEVAMLSLAYRELSYLPKLNENT